MTETHIKTIEFYGKPTGGTFQITLDGVTTRAMPWNATEEQIQQAVDEAIQKRQKADRQRRVNQLIRAAGVIAACVLAVSIAVWLIRIG